MKVYFLIFYFIFINLSIKAQTFVTMVTVAVPNDLDTKYIHSYITYEGEIIYTENQNLTLNEQIFPFNNGLGKIRRNDKFGYINQKGEIVIPIIYDKAEEFSNGLALVKIEGKWGFINSKNELIIKPVYKAGVRKFSGGFAIYGRDGKFGYLNTKGEEITKPLFDRVCYFSNNKAWVLLNGKWGCINTKGEFIINPYYSDTQDFSEGYAWVKKDLIWGLIDSTNTYVIQPNERNPLIYAHSANVKNFTKLNNGLLFTKSNEKFGFCNISLKKTIPNKFERVLDFANGCAVVRIDGKWGIIDTLGNYIIEPKFIDIKYLNHDFFAIKEKNGNWGIIYKNGKKITESIYHSIFEFEDTFL